MIHMTKKKTEPKEVNVLDYIECDWCHAKSGSDGLWIPGSYPQLEQTNEVKSVTIESDPDGGGCATGKQADLCPTCIGKVFNFLDSQGCRIQKVDDAW